MSHGWLVGGCLGAALGLGLVLVLLGLPWLRRPGLDARLQPYLDDTLRPSGLLPEPGRTASALLPQWTASPLTVLGGRLERAVGGAASIRCRLVQAGRPPDVEAFRAEQVLWGCAGLAVGGLGAAGLVWQRSAAVLPLVVLVLLGGVSGVAARDWQLARTVRRRERQLLAEFPTVAEMLALAVGAGEGPVGALQRVSQVSTGELSAELRQTLADARAGASLVQALQGLADRTALVPLVRFVDGVVVAVERGTPLAEVLRAQAQDAREAGRRALMDSAGRKEIAMMVPVVFGVLPVTVLFAVFPGFAFLRLSL